MLFDRKRTSHIEEHYYADISTEDDFYQQSRSQLVWVILVAFIIFIVMASLFHIDQVARTTGEVIASSRVQVIQAVDGGVLSELLVKEGDRVYKGQVIARLEQTRIKASVGEVEARLSALIAKVIRLRAEVTKVEELSFPEEVLEYPEFARVERALFKQRRQGFIEQIRTLKVAVTLAKEEVSLVKKLSRSGDVNRSEVIRGKKALNEAEARLANRKNEFYEEASDALTKVEDEIAQNKQILTQRRQQLGDSVFKAMRSGIVKNIRITTVGGVLRAGEELMQIIPVDDDLIVETKVSPADISMVRIGQDANIRFDPFDYTIYGSVKGEVVYVSADTLKESTAQGEEIYYRVHVIPSTVPVTTTTGKVLDILPGMTAQVDIRSGTRTLMVYLLKPLRKTLAESFGER